MGWHSKDGFQGLTDQDNFSHNNRPVFPSFRTFVLHGQEGDLSFVSERVFCAVFASGHGFAGKM